MSQFVIPAAIGLLGEERPIDISLEHSEELDREWNEYFKRGEYLADHQDDRLKALLKEIETLQGSKSEMIPFIYLDGSSGVGKTQMAITLEAVNHRVFYIPCSPVGTNSQLIYRRFINRAEACEECIWKDFKAFRVSKVEPDRVKGDWPLWLVGFLHAWLRGESTCLPATVDQVREDLERMVVKPLVFLDEFPEYRGASENEKSRYLRNIFRALKLVVIVSSTHSSAHNLLLSAGDSRGRMERRKWCHIVPVFPKFACESLAGQNAFEECLLRSSRPLCSVLASQYFALRPRGQRDCTFYDNMAKFIGDRLVRGKRKKGVREALDFVHGQISLFLAASYFKPESEADNNRAINVVIMRRHFATILEDNPFDLYLDGDELCVLDQQESSEQQEPFDQLELSEGSQTVPWTLCTKFPLMQCDPLLYMSLLGGRRFHPIADRNGRRQSFRSAVDSYMERALPVLDFGNPVQRSKDGMKQEAVMAASVTLASRRQGFRGIGAFDFIEELAIELDLPFSRNPSKQLDTVKSCLSSVVIPYLAPPNVSWPDFFEDAKKNFGMNVGCISRTFNSDRIDFAIEGFPVMGEVKDFTDDVNLPRLEKILDRVRPTTKLHLVLVNSLQKDYYVPSRTTKTFDAFRSTHPNLADAFICSLDGGQFSEINGVVNPKSLRVGKIVLFISVAIYLSDAELLEQETALGEKEELELKTLLRKRRKVSTGDEKELIARLKKEIDVAKARKRKADEAEIER